MDFHTDGIQVLNSFFSIVNLKLIYSHEKIDIDLRLHGFRFDGIRARTELAFEARKEGRS